MIEVHACGYAYENEGNNYIAIYKQFWERIATKGVIRWIALLAITGLGSESHFYQVYIFLNFSDNLHRSTNLFRNAEISTKYVLCKK